MKKDAKLLASMKEKFIEGAVKNGEHRVAVEEFWEQLLEFARYSFNASHAYSYGHLTYYTAWLKTHYPLEFYTAIISNEEDADKQAIYMEDARQNGIQILPPDINTSDIGFTPSGDNIVYGFSGIKGVGESVYNQFKELRPFYGFADFLLKTYLYGTRINKKVYDALILSGTLDTFGFKRSVMIANYERFLLDFDQDDKIKKEMVANKRIPTDAIKARIKEFLSLEDEYFVDNSIKEYTLLEILEMEMSLLGVYISGNPFEIVLPTIQERHYTYSNIIETVEQSGRFAGNIVLQINNAKKHTTKTGSLMFFVDAVDHTGKSINLAAFGDTAKKNQDIIRNGSILFCFVSAKYSTKGDGSIDFIINGVKDLSSDMERASRQISKSKVIKEARLHIDGIPSSVRFKSIMNKLDAICGNLDISLATGSVYLDIRINDSCTVTIGPKYIKEISVETIRSFNALPNVTVSTR